MQLRRDELPTYEEKYRVTFHSLFHGRHHCPHLPAKIDPGAGFESVEPNLEDGLLLRDEGEIPALETNVISAVNGLGEGFVSFEFFNSKF